MRPYRSSQSWISTAAKVLGTKLAPHAGGEACGPCPICGGKDRFICFVEGNYFCRRCGHKGWWIDNPDEGRRAMALERERSEREQMALRSQMAQCQDWAEYHGLALEMADAREEWARHGMRGEEIKKWGLGYCESCPTAPDYRSLTIPFFQEGVLLDIRHRLVDAPKSEGKYRPHLVGLTSPIFNLDGVATGRAITVVEGAKKAIILDRFGVKAPIGLPGLAFRKRLPGVLSGRLDGRGVIIALDPDAGNEAKELASALVGVGVEDVRVADFFMKPDDLALAYGPDPLNTILRQALRYRGNGRR